MNHSYCKRDMNGPSEIGDRSCASSEVSSTVLYYPAADSPWIILGILAYFTPKGNIAPSDLFPSALSPSSPPSPIILSNYRTPLHVSSSIYRLLFVP